MDQGGVFVILFKMVRYHQKKYPSYIPLHLEEVAGHFDVRRVFRGTDQEHAGTKRH